ncbi:MAG: type II toxin-antitoxin system VapC family toxin [Thiofilum sp.]|uniref:type II toxin-antitoxin system VapC family toxin n=1 Tax=Thiofilum sp. TaxID=2212733 RepID=UPI0025E547E3|nr:type II toxin-antitoxin system VapC family toxin [Thiofilum sp.]MBK8454074.1 type II toxin-antitoxin system VapC family toxin [Thiofilum sp.]
MMIDSSVLIAILENEPEAARLIEAIADDSVKLISAVSVVETSIVILNRRGEAGVKELDAFLQEAGIETVAVTPEQATLARHAYERYGKGRHPAKLNFGDCFSYAAALACGEPLLFKGNDFSETDIPCCIDWKIN